MLLLVQRESTVTLMTENRTPRLRTINAAARELKQLDPGTAMSSSAIRKLVKGGAIPCIYSGTRAYLNFDSLLSYLHNPEQTHTLPEKINGISRFEV